MPVTAGILQFMLRGDTAQFEKDMARGGKAIKKLEGDAKTSAASIVKSLKQMAGEESVLGNLAKIGRGAGAVAGLALVGNMFEKVTASAATMFEEMRRGETTISEMAKEMGRSIPILGSFVRGVDNTIGIVTGETKESIQREIDGAKTFIGVLDEIQARRDELSGHTDKFAGIRKTVAGMPMNTPEHRRQADIAADGLKSLLAEDKKHAADEAMNKEYERAFGSDIMSFADELAGIEVRAAERAIEENRIAEAEYYRQWLPNEINSFEEEKRAIETRAAERALDERKQREDEYLAQWGDDIQKFEDELREAAVHSAEAKLSKRNAMIAGAESMMDTIRGAANTLPSFLESGSGDAISAINKANAGARTSEESIAKAALDASIKQLEEQKKTRELIAKLVEGGQFDGHNI